MFFRAAAKRRIPEERLTAGTGYDAPHLKDKHERIEWSAFVTFMKNAGEIWSQEELVGFSAGFLRSPFVRSLFMPARLLFSPADLYRWAIGQKKGGGDHLFPCIENSYSTPAPDHARLELTLPEGYAPCPEFFLISRGVFSEIPTLLGLGKTEVKMSEIPRGVRYDITIPKARNPFWVVLRALAYPITLTTAARELKDTHEALLSRYAELEDAKAKLDDLNRNLERKVEERTAELALTVKKLEDAQKARDELFANINHEIRTPLSLVLLSANDLETRLAGADSAARERVRSIEGSARRLLRLVDALLTLAARQEGRLALKIVGIDVVPLLEELVAGFKPGAESLGLALSYDGPARAVVAADAAALDRIVTNLVSNALKFTPRGGSIDVTVRERDDALEIAVRDSGIGIDEEFRSRIFGRFEQGRAAVHAGSHGSGLGLSLVKELAEAHGGSVSLESQNGRGSKFTVVLPRSAAAGRSAALTSGEATRQVAPIPMRALPADFGIHEPPTEAREVIEPHGTADATILIAEDDPELRAQIASMLEGRYRLLLAADGLSALRLARKHLPDLLVSDVGMPGMDGLELTRQFRELQGNRLAPVVLLTAYGNLGDRLKGFDAGAVDYVLKPFEPAELKARIRSQLELRTLALKLHETEKLAALGVLSSGLAHELRNPANGIVNALPPLKDLLPPELLAADTPTGQLFKVIDDCARQVGVLSRDLLGLRSGEALSRAEEPFARIVERAFALGSPALQGVTVRNECEYLGPLNCAGALVTRIVQNLLENGAHAAGPGGWVRITSRREGNLFVFECTDSGPGIPPAIRERIFEPFFTTKAPGQGTGLGLTTSRDLARRHGGNLSLRDGETGIVFRLELPCEAESGTDATVKSTGRTA